MNFNYQFDASLECVKKAFYQFGNFLQPISACRGHGAFSKVVIGVGECIQLCRKGN